MTSPHVGPQVALTVSRYIRSQLGLQKAAVFYALILVVGSFVIATTLKGNVGAYLTLSNASTVLFTTTFMGILTIFMAVVLISGNFDLSIASTTALSATLALKIVPYVDEPVVLVICLFLGVVIGVINGVLVVHVGINAFIVTLAMQTALRALVYLVSGGYGVAAPAGDLTWFTSDVIPLPLSVLPAVACLAVALALWRRRDHLTREFLVAGVGAALVFGLFAAWFQLAVGTAALLNRGVWIFALITLCAWFFLRFTVAGYRLYAVGSNAEASRLAGINVKRYQLGAFVASGTAAAFVGVMVAGTYQALDPGIFLTEELNAMTAAVIGGVALFGGAGNVAKAAVGAILVTAITNGLVFLNVRTQWQGITQGFLLILAAAMYVQYASRRRSDEKKRDDINAGTEEGSPRKEEE